jgi:CelD/BcsL family acetyltransferase involved in cellulose biosynthesis
MRAPTSSVHEARVLRIDAVTTTAALESLRPEWGELWERCPSATPFQSPEWTLAWWRHFGSGDLWTLTFRRGERLVGVAPLFVCADTERAERRLLFIGTGISDYLDALLDPEIADEGGEAIMRHLGRCGGPWDYADLHELPVASPLLAAARVEEGLAAVVPQSVCLVVGLPASVEEYLASLSKGRRNNLRLVRRRLAASDACIERADEHTLPAFLAALFDLHAARWRERQLPGVLADPQVQAFHREVAAELLHRGSLRLHRLCHAGGVAAVLYGFTHGDRWCYYLGGLDPASQALSPGAVLIAHAIEEAIAEGRRVFDFLRGREPYKYAWGAVDEPTCRLFVRRGAQRGTFDSIAAAKTRGAG